MIWAIKTGAVAYRYVYEYLAKKIIKSRKKET